MIYLAILVAFCMGYLIHILQHTLQQQLYNRKQGLIEQTYAERICQLTEQINSSLQLNVELIEEKKRLQRRLSELQNQHERTLAALN